MESQWTLSSSPAARPASAAATRIGVRQVWAAWWHAVLARRACQRTATILKDLDEHVLRDIGAPGWALRDREALCQMQHNRQAHWLWT
ncbi:hypothetical protein [Bordetella sp. BOR01]|uniref:hypothetical protein n=1 Tax=Bordetella sp. BOR01 TaxID=2854779 RepID=UPI001C437F1D|nr:hypothetical protein [Bordetella sp. BOR01]MBV7486720.1 hypothetical protein [Bordetella sp. BOR01]